MQPRVKTILTHLKKPGACLRKAYRNKRGGGRKRGGGPQVAVEYFIEPAGIPVREQFAIAAINSGCLLPRDSDLFADPDNSQAWVLHPHRAPSRR
jgi:hypothetical protein